MNGRDWRPQDFSTFSPKMIAGIGRLPSTIEDRSIQIRLKRARRDEHRERFRKRKVKPEGDKLKSRIEEWTAANLEALRDTQPQLPDELNDRQQDVCEPLLAIADVAGGEWPERARSALLTLCIGPEPADDSIGLHLLSDVRQVFRHSDSDRMPTAELLEYLLAMQDSPWSDLERGRPLNAFQLSQLLCPFDVHPRDIRFNNGIRKGYRLQDLQESWDRYLPELDIEGQQGQQANIYAAPGHLCEGQQACLVADGKCAKSAVNIGIVADVAPSSIELPLSGKV